MSLILYMIVLLLSLNISTWWWMWMTFEMLNWLLLFMMNSNYVLLFLLLQSMLSLFIVFWMVSMKTLGFLFLLFKMGIPPFHGWVINNQLMWSSKSFLLFISLHKWTPTIILMNLINYFWVAVIFMMMSFMLWANFYLKLLIFSISINDMGWLLFSWLNSLKLFFIYLIVNLLTFIMMMYIVNKNYSSINMDLQLLLLFMMNMPPFMSFLIKWMILSNVPVMLSITSLIISWLMIIMIWYWLAVQLLNNSKEIKTTNLITILIFTLSMWLI